LFAKRRSRCWRNKLKLNYWYLPKGSNAPLLCLDGSPFIVPPLPTWREFIHGICMRLYPGQIRPESLDGWRRYYDVELDQLDLPADPAEWQREHDIWLSPQARASALLQGIHFGPDLDRSYGGNGVVYQRPHIQFRAELIGAKLFRRWVTASDLVALSLLQARLIELGKPIKIVEGKSVISASDAARSALRSESDMRGTLGHVRLGP